MNEPTDQMSLLDAIGLAAPKETQRPEKNQEIATDAAKQSSRKPAGTRKAAARKETKIDPSSAATNKANASAVETSRTKGNVPSFAPADIDAPAPDRAAEALTLDKHLCFALYSANHAMHGVYKTLLKDLGLTYPQFLAMTVLWETNNVPVGALTSKLQLDTNTLTPLLKRLEGMDLLTRTRNKKDERQVIVKLTRKGRALQKKTESFGSCIFSATGLPLEEIVDLQSRIMKLRDNLRNAETDA